MDSETQASLEHANPNLLLKQFRYGIARKRLAEINALFTNCLKYEFSVRKFGKICIFLLARGRNGLQAVQSVK